MPNEKIGLDSVFNNSGFMDGVAQYQKGLDSAIDSTGAAIQKMGKLDTFLAKAQTTYKQTRQAINILNQGLQYAQVAYEGTIGVALDYNQSIKDFSLSTGLGMEETSRLTQAISALGISTEVAANALEAMSQRGINPTIENLARLSDKYLSLAPGVERNTWAATNLGQSYEKIVPLLAAGGDEIRKLTANANELLIVTDKDYAATERYKMMLGQVKGETYGLQVAIGNKLIPELIREAEIAKLYLAGASEMIKKTSIMDDVFDKLGDSLFGAGRAGDFVNDWLYGWLELEEPVIKKSEDLTDVLNQELTPAVTKLGNASKSNEPKVSGFGGSVAQVEGTAKSGKKELRKFNDDVLETGYAAERTTPYLEDMTMLMFNRRTRWQWDIIVNGSITDIADLGGGMGGGMGGCFIGSTPVRTPAGDKPIKEIAKGDFIVAYDTQEKKFKAARVVAKKVYSRSDMLTVTVGKVSVSCSPNHPFLTDQGWIEAQYVDKYKVVTQDGLCGATITTYPGTYKVYDLQVEPYNTYVVNGIVVHNKLVEVGGMAGGGFLEAGVPSWVGEKGPEIIVPRVPVQVLPNNKINDYFSSMSPVFSRQAMIGGGGMGVGGTSNTTNNWNFRLNTMSGPTTIQRSYQMARLING